MNRWLGLLLLAGVLLLVGVGVRDEVAASSGRTVLVAPGERGAFLLSPPRRVRDVAVSAARTFRPASFQGSGATFSASLRTLPVWGQGVGAVQANARLSSRPKHSAAYYRLMARGLAADRAELRRANRVLRRSLYHASRRRTFSTSRYSARYAIQLAAVTFRQPLGDMLRVAECESPGLDASLVNREPIYNGEHATGLFQFIPSTWASTPFAGFDIFDPVANSLAAGWMWANGRRREWACQ